LQIAYLLVVTEFEKSEGRYSDLITVIKETITMNSSNNYMLNCPTLLTGMSHEVRTHMNAIVAFSFLMKENNCSNKEKDEFSNQIFNSCEQLIGLLDSFLDSALIESGFANTDNKTCKLDNLLDELFTEFREIIRKDEHKDIELITEAQFNNSIEVNIDKERVSRTIRSLFKNSLKNTKSGYIKIGYNLSETGLDFHVLDSGQGYFKSKEFLSTHDMTQSLSQYNDTYSAINLILAKNLVQVLEGTLRIECNGLSGSGIYFSVPVRMISSSENFINNYVKSMIAI
jgi:K+-sensing histidine kinase KdpD